MFLYDLFCHYFTLRYTRLHHDVKRTSLHSSTRMKKRSNRDMMGGERVMFCRRDLVRSYRPPIGFAAARIEVRAFSVAFTPAW